LDRGEIKGQEVEELWIFITCVSKSRRIRWAERIERMGEKRNACGYCRESRGKETTMKTKTQVGVYY
jgi:hypothetical protein